MSELDKVGSELKRHIFDLIVPLQTTKDVRVEAFNAADAAGRELTRLLKGHEMLPKTILFELDRAAGILENEAPYSRDEQKVLAMSHAFRLTFGLILLGESHDDRKPGVPRVR
jgi:hypothetical protein